MMRRIIWAGIAVTLLVASIAPASSMNVAIPFTAIDFWCEEGNIVQSSEPLVAGTSSVSVVDLDEKRFLVTSILSPAEFPDSTWVVPGRGRVVPDGFIVNHLGTGTGDLEGGMIQFKVTPVDVEPPEDCTVAGPIVLLDGVIVFPPNNAQ